MSKNKFKLFLPFLFLLHSTFAHAEMSRALLQTMYENIVEKIPFDNSGRLREGLSKATLPPDVCTNFSLEPYGIPPGGRWIYSFYDLTILLKMAALCDKPAEIEQLIKTSSPAYKWEIERATKQAFVIAAALNHVASLKVFIAKSDSLVSYDYMNALIATGDAESRPSDAELLLLKTNRIAPLHLSAAAAAMVKATPPAAAPEATPAPKPAQAAPTPEQDVSVPTEPKLTSYSPTITIVITPTTILAAAGAIIVVRLFNAAYLLNDLDNAVQSLKGLVQDLDNTLHAPPPPPPVVDDIKEL